MNKFVQCLRMYSNIYIQGRPQGNVLPDIGRYFFQVHERKYCRKIQCFTRTSKNETPNEFCCPRRLRWRRSRALLLASRGSISLSLKISVTPPPSRALLSIRSLVLELSFFHGVGLEPDALGLEWSLLWRQKDSSTRCTHAIFAHMQNLLRFAKQAFDALPAVVQTV